MDPRTSTIVVSALLAGTAQPDQFFEDVHPVRLSCGTPVEAGRAICCMARKLCTPP
jgi:hypothetical protein